MRILKTLSRLFVCAICALSLCTSAFAWGNMPLGDVGEYGNWLTGENVTKITDGASGDMEKFQEGFQSQIRSAGSVPLEAKLGLSFMRALSAIDYVLQKSLVRFVIVFLFIMYAFWITIEAYKMIRETSDYKTVLYDIFKKGIIIAIWVSALNYGPAKIFTMLIEPILALGATFSDFILNAVADTYNQNFPDTCGAIQQYVENNAATDVANGNTAGLLVSPKTAANIMCLPAQISVFFYHGISAAWKWMLGGFGHSGTQIVMGAICIVVFIKCVFKYAFMTLGIVASLFLTLLMLPFTALAEAMPTTTEKNYAGQIFSGFLKLFNTKKLSAVISVFVNAAIYFISLSIIIAICAALLANVISISNTPEYSAGGGMAAILCGCLVLHLANKAKDLAEQIGGSIDNTFGQKLQDDSKKLWGNAKSFSGKIYKDWIKKK